MTVVCFIVLAGGVGLFGCGGLYLMKLGVGQARILIGRRPISEVLADPAVDPAVKTNLRLILDVRAFAEEDLGLDAAGQYRYFFDTGGLPIVWNITASPKDRLQAYTWKFPIVGEVPYKGFFDKADAIRASDSLIAQGYDTSLGSAQAFSTLGWFSDPVFTSMILRRPEEVVETVVHELTHATIYLKGETPFNESLATFVGGAGAVEFLKERHGSDSPQVRFARALFTDRETFSGVIADLEGELVALYAEPISLGEKLSRREEVFERAKARVREEGLFETREFDFFADLDLNNAVVLAFLNYHTRIDFFEEILKEEGGDLRRTISRIGSDPKEICRQWRKEER